MKWPNGVVSQKNYSRKQIAVAISQSIRKTLHKNTFSAALVEGCVVSAWYLVGGKWNKPVLIIRCLGLEKSMSFYVF